MNAIRVLTSLCILGPGLLSSGSLTHHFEPRALAVVPAELTFCSDCDSETVALIAAEADFVAASNALDAAEDAYENDPSNENALAVVIARADYDAAVAALQIAQSGLQG